MYIRQVSKLDNFSWRYTK